MIFCSGILTTVIKVESASKDFFPCFLLFLEKRVLAHDSSWTPPVLKLPLDWPQPGPLGRVLMPQLSFREKLNKTEPFPFDK